MNSHTLLLFLILMPFIAIAILLTVGVILLFVKGVRCVDSPLRCIFSELF